MHNQECVLHHPLHVFLLLFAVIIAIRNIIDSNFLLIGNLSNLHFNVKFLEEHHSELELITGTYDSSNQHHTRTNNCHLLVSNHNIVWTCNLCTCMWKRFSCTVLKHNFSTKLVIMCTSNCCHVFCIEVTLLGQSFLINSLDWHRQPYLVLRPASQSAEVQEISSQDSLDPLLDLYHYKKLSDSILVGFPRNFTWVNSTCLSLPWFTKHVIISQYCGAWHGKVAVANSIYLRTAAWSILICPPKCGHVKKHVKLTSPPFYFFFFLISSLRA